MAHWSKADVTRLRRLMQSQGRSTEEIAEEIRTLSGCSRLAAYRMAHGLSQPEAVTRYGDSAGASFMDQPLLSRLEQFPERGSRSPLAAQLIVFASMYGTTPMRLLSASALERIPLHERNVLIRCSSTFTTPSGPEQRYQSHQADDEISNDDYRNIGKQVSMAARRALRFAAISEGTNVGPETLDELKDGVVRISKVYLHQTLPSLLGDLVELQNLSFRILEGRQRPSQTKDLYLLAGITSGLLAKASHDMGDPRSAMAQARTAYICADNAEHDGLRVWIRGLQSLVAYWAGWPHEALRYAQLGQQYSENLTGSTAVWLQAQEARAHAVLGDASSTMEAIQRTEQARERTSPDDLDNFGGLFTFTQPRQLYYTADAAVWLPEGTERAESDASLSLAGYRDACAEERSFGDEAGARTDLALARAERGELEGAREALIPVLSLPPDKRINGVIVSAMRVHESLRKPSCAGSHVASDLREEIESFCQTPVAVLPR
jgi:hypothetical protein